MTYKSIPGIRAALALSRPQHASAAAHVPPQEQVVGGALGAVGRAAPLARAFSSPVQRLHSGLWPGERP
jgi:hypothetical protein